MIGTPFVNLLDLLATQDTETVDSIISDFSCPYNADVEDFLRYKAIEFARQRLAATYLLFKQYQGNNVMAGYFSLAQKYFHVDLDKRGKISSNLRRKIRKFGTYDADLKKYLVPAVLIGQLGKNYAHGYDSLLTGDELLTTACGVVAKIQQISSGKLVYLECEDSPKLLAFYERNGFHQFARRMLDGDETGVKGEYLCQLFKYL